MPFPANYVQGIDLQKWDFERGFWSYLNGQWRKGGWWYYYIYAITIKEPVGTLLLFVLAIVLTLDRHRFYCSSYRDELIVVVIPVAVMALVSWQSGINIGIRYALPAFPFLFVWISKVAQVFMHRSNVAAYFVTVCTCWSALSSLVVYPHSLSYFNELVGGPRNGHLRLLDSNTDWGQDLLYAKRWLERNEVDQAYMGCFVDYIDPKDVGVAVELADRLNPRAGWHVISVNERHSRRGDFRYLSEMTPVAMVGYTHCVYYIPDERKVDK